MYDDYGYDDQGYDEYGDDRGYPDDRGPRRRAPPPPDPGPPPRDLPPPKKVSYKCIGGMVVAIIALIMLFIFMSYPWYEINYSATFELDDNERDLTMEYDLEEITVEMKVGNYTMKNSTAYDEPEIKDEVSEVKEIMDNLQLLIWITMILLIIAIIVIPIAAIGKIPHASGMIFLVIAIIMVLIIPVYFFFSFPPAIESQFEAMGDMPEPLNETFIYNGEFLSSGRGTWYDDDNNKWSYSQEWGPGMAFWMIFVPLITIVVAQVVYSSGKADLGYNAPPRDVYSRPPPPPRGRGRGRPVRDYGPPRPMRGDDYDQFQDDRGPPPRSDDYGYREPPPPPPRRGGGPRPGPGPGYARDYGPGPGGRRPPPPPRPPRRRDGYH